VPKPSAYSMPCSWERGNLCWRINIG
jgi:hypothetical protein